MRQRAGYLSYTFNKPQIPWGGHFADHAQCASRRTASWHCNVITESRLVIADYFGVEPTQNVSSHLYRLLLPSHIAPPMRLALLLLQLLAGLGLCS